MRFKTLLLTTFIAVSTLASAQFYSLSASYSPTFESWSAGFGFNTNEFLMDYQLGIGDEFFSMGMDLSFTVVPDLFRQDYNLTRLYFGVGGEMYLMDEYDQDLGYSLFGLITLSHNLVGLSYGYGIYEYDGIPTGELEGFHKLKLTIFISEIEYD